MKMVHLLPSAELSQLTTAQNVNREKRANSERERERERERKRVGVVFGKLVYLCAQIGGKFECNKMTKKMSCKDRLTTKLFFSGNPSFSGNLPTICRHFFLLYSIGPRVKVKFAQMIGCTTFEIRFGFECARGFFYKEAVSAAISKVLKETFITKKIQFKKLSSAAAAAG
jgi:hypothetical protein